MTPLADICDKKRSMPSHGLFRHTARGASGAAPRALSVIKWGRDLGALVPAITACLSAIAGVSQVHVDPARRNIQILYDGGRGTLEDVHRFLSATGWGNAGILQHPWRVTVVEKPPDRMVPATADMGEMVSFEEQKAGTQTQEEPR
jgi:hypothetical protein